MSKTLPHLYQMLLCKFHKHAVDTDAQQTKKHLWTHSYEELLKTARDINLVQGYSRPTKTELIDFLAENSVIRSNQDG